MKLQQVIADAAVKSIAGDIDGVHISRIDYDSRSVESGSLFCALQGSLKIGSDFVDEAVSSGATAILSDSEPKPGFVKVPWIKVEDARKAMAVCAAALHEYPSSQIPVVGVTGTNGKTTTAFILHHLMQSSMGRAGMLGTVKYQIGAKSLEAHRTTPESPDVQKMLREMVDSECGGAVMEVASHGLVQHRADAIKFSAGVFTNLSQDHLDYHKTLESYFKAKCMLFEMMDAWSSEGVMIVNADDRYGERLSKMPFQNLRKVTFGCGAGSNYRLSGIRVDQGGTRFSLSIGGRQVMVKIPLIGRYNAFNAVAALISGEQIGLNLRESIANLACLPQIPGRLESVACGQPYRVVVDYAHTPDALSNVLGTIRDMNPSRIITVFGCGGDRDAEKRPLMGAAASGGSDYTIVTTDNPRFEEPIKIISDIEKGMSGRRYEVVEEREKAIRKAISVAEENDVVVIAGKGHETYQEIAGKRFSFDDREVVAMCIKQKI